MILALARVPLAQLLRTPRAWATLAAWCGVALVAALTARFGGGVATADHVLRGTYGGLVLPLGSYAVVRAVLGGAGLREAITPVVDLGAPPRAAALANVLVAVVSAASLGGVLAGVVCVVAHGPHDAPLFLDVPASLFVGALGGAAYAAFFSAGSAIGRGRAAAVLLAFDWFVGSAAGAGSLVTPRGHVQSLLGGPLAAEVSRTTSSIVLVALAAVYFGFAVRRARRT